MESTFIFLGRLYPRELCSNLGFNNPLRLSANLNVVLVRDGLAVEYIGQYDNFDRLREQVHQALDSLLAAHAYYASDSKPLLWISSGWIESRGIISRDNVVGFIDPILGETAPNGTDPSTIPFQSGISLLPLVERVAALRLALRDYYIGRREQSDDAVLFAFRCVEDIRRHYQAGTSDKERKAAWAAMHDELGTTKLQFDDLTGISEAIRHGEQLNLAAADRSVYLDQAHNLLRLFIAAKSKEHHLFVP